ncbi:MAG: cytochrome b/b6 domain-containing protein [Pseudomonadota bacterium]
MMRTSTSHRYGRVAVGLHWLIAILIPLALASGYAADAVKTGQAAYLTFHVGAGSLAGILTILRVVWWWGFDTRPGADPATTPWARRAAGFVHGLLIVLPLLALASGIGLFAISGAGAVLFGGGTGALPVFENYPPRHAHGLVTRLLLICAGLHVAAALYHTFVLRDGLLDRMRLQDTMRSSGNRS